MKIILLKLGGSLITDKTKPYTTRPEIIGRIVTEIKEAIAAKPDVKIIIGNGAGSFAHQSAKKYGTINGYETEEEKLGFCKVQHDAITLNRILVEEFLKQEVPVVGIAPSALFMAKNKSYFYQDMTILDQYLEKNIMPVIHGDAILDIEAGSTIYSTDQLVEILGRYFKENGCKVKCISAGNYDGVWDNKGSVISEITQQNFEEIKSFFFNSDKVDVTGGMGLKVKEMLKLAKIGIKSIIINGMEEGYIKKAILGEKLYGTVIY